MKAGTSASASPCTWSPDKKILLYSFNVFEHSDMVDKSYIDLTRAAKTVIRGGLRVHTYSGTSYNVLASS